MDYSMMPPPQTTSCASGVVAGSVSGDFSGAGGGHYSSESSPNQLFNNEQNQQSSQSGQYKPHFSRRAHVNRPPPLSLHETYYRDTLTQSSAALYSDHQPSHHIQSPLVVPHSPLVESSGRGVPQSPHLQQNPHILHRQSSAPHLVQSPHLAQSPHLSNYTGGEMSPRPTPAHMQSSLYSADRTHSPLPLANSAYESSPIHPHKPRHFSDSSQSPHPYSVHPATPVHIYNNNAPIPSPHHYTADPIPSPHHFNDPNPSPHHFNDPNPSPFNDPGPHRSTYLDNSQPGTPATAVYSHPGTPVAGYVDSPHQHLSPHPRAAAYQHFFGPNLPLPVNGGAPNSSADSSALDMANNGSAAGQFSQQSSTDSSQHPGGSSAAMLHAGGQGDAMLSAINLNQESETGLQDTQSNHTETAMDTDWPGTPQKIKSGSTAPSGYALFDNGSNPPGVDELLSQATDYIANSSTLSLSEVPKEAAKLKPRPKGRPSKNTMSPRAYGAQCPICGKTFNNSSALAKHKLTHSDERKYVCHLCSKAFKRQDHLNGHMMTHRTKKPFECSFDGCTKSYCDARSLRRHLENHHNVPTETLYDMSLPNYGLNNGGSVGNMYTGFHGDPSTPSPHASPSYPNVPGQQYFRFDQGHANPANESTQQTYMYSSSDTPPQPAECTLCHKRFKNLPALNGHMRLHGGYVNVKKPESNDTKGGKIESGDGAGNGISKKQLSRPHQQLSASNKTPFSSTSSASRDSSSSGQNLMALNNKYNMEQNVVGNNALSMSSPGDDPSSQSNINQNNNQGNVRQGGDGFMGLAPNFLGATLRMNTPSSSEPPMFPTNTLASQFTFTPMDQQRQMFNEQIMLMAQQQQLRQIQGTQPATSFPALPMLSVNTPAQLPDQMLVEMANRARADSFHSLMNSPATSKLSDLSQEGRVITPVKDKDSLATTHLLHLPQQVGDTDLLMGTLLDREDHEVSQITSGDVPVHIDLETTNTFLADRKRHASAPEKLVDRKVWPQHQPDQQQQLNERYAKAQEMAQHPTSHRRHRRMSADNHNHRSKELKHSNSYSHTSGDLLTRSDGAVLFRSPPPGGVKKRKHRPEPLVIPPNVTAVQSRLRSPRIWEPGESHSVRHTGRTPPPYTPPPILSPMRSGTGLFRGVYWRPPIATGGGLLSASLPAAKLAQLQQKPILEEPEQTIVQPAVHPTVQQPAVQPYLQRSHSLLQTQQSLLQTHPSIVESMTQEEPEIESQVPPAPETDIQPHINIGTDHQASLPALKKNIRDAERDADRATLLWTPECLDHSLTVQELTAYMDFSCSAAVPGSGSNKEYALHQLYFNKGDIKRSILCLMSKRINPTFVKFIGDYHYQDSDVWTTAEIELYTESIMKNDKDFNSITKAFRGKKTHKQCIEFYYLWKKICREEYKRVRIIRRKRRHSELYNLRSRAGRKGVDSGVETLPADANSEDEDSASQVSDFGEADDEDMVSDAPSSIASAPQAMPTHFTQQQVAYQCEYPGCGAAFTSKPALNGHGKMHVLPRPTHTMDNMRIQHSPAVKKVKSEPVAPGPGSEEFPCKLCGKVFYKVKSRSAHMKSHSVLAKKARDAAKPVNTAKHPS